MAVARADGGNVNSGSGGQESGGGGEAVGGAAQICSSLIGFWFCKLKNVDGRATLAFSEAACMLGKKWQAGRQETGRKKASSSSPLTHSLTHSLTLGGATLFNPFLSSPARFINGSFSLSVFPFLSVLRRGAARPDVKLNVTV